MPTTTNRHGDEYPEESDYADSMPSRVLKGQGNSQMTGYAVVDGMPFGRITATQNDTWTDAAKERLSEVGAPPGLAHHVEVKTAMMAIQTGATEAEVTINHAPCGSEKGETGGCNEHLPAILPPGCRLTVLGTDAQGRAYKQTYEGKQR